MGRWAAKKENDTAVVNAILLMRRDPDAGLQRIRELADDAGKHDKNDAAVMRKLLQGHEHLAG